jgi:hypothetical protein
VGCLLLMEVSNPSMHLNQLLKELGKSDSTLATVNQARSECGVVRQSGVLKLPRHAPPLPAALRRLCSRCCF